VTSRIIYGREGCLPAVICKLPNFRVADSGVGHPGDGQASERHFAALNRSSPGGHRCLQKSRRAREFGTEKGQLVVAVAKYLLFKRTLFWVVRLAQPYRNAQPEENQQEGEKHTAFGSNRSAGQPAWAKEIAIK
jgi:hypothetical protein